MPLAPYEFGQKVARELMPRRAKQADMMGNVMGFGRNAAQLGGQMWNNSARAFKGMTGAVGGTIGAAGAGLAAGGMQGANAVGGLFGKQPFSNETINTAHGVADHYANVGSAYGQDFANSVGLGSQGLAGTTQGGSLGDDAWHHIENQPGVTQNAKQISQIGRNTLNTASNIAPAAALAGASRMFAPAGHGASAPTTAASSPASTVTQRAMQTGRQLGRESAISGTIDRGRNFLHNAFHTADQMTEANNPLGVGTHIAQHAVTPNAGGH